MTNQISCIFCKIITGEVPCYKIWENDHFLAFLDANPINPGHTLIIPKDHANDLFDLSPTILRELGETVQKVAHMVKIGTQADGINLGMNNGRAAGQLIFHTHIHIIPRFEGDGFKHWRAESIPNKEEFIQMQAKVINYPGEDRGI
ncbi:MAG: HIT family protein [Candidatus Paceibacterota bacterium]|jgi:histidine triad (HIT) family protein